MKHPSAIIEPAPTIQACQKPFLIPLSILAEFTGPIGAAKLNPKTIYPAKMLMLMVYPSLPKESLYNLCTGSALSEHFFAIPQIPFLKNYRNGGEIVDAIEGGIPEKGGEF